jgi:phage terminase Nu1 subunit (DNA packaging protein)
LKPKLNDVTGSVAELGDLLNLPPKNLSKLAGSGVLARDKARGKYLMKKSVAKYCDHIRRAATGRESEAVIQRRRLLRCQADFAETRAKIESGALVAANDVEALWSGTLRTIRAMVMATPSRAAARIPHLDRHGISEVDFAVREALTAAANDTPETPSPRTASTTNPIAPPGE